MDPKLAASVSNFAVRFCNEIDKDSSFVCSPLSAQSLLALTALGCAGASRAELLRAMDLTDDDAIRSSFSYFTSTLKTVEKVTLRIANKVYVTINECDGTLKPAIQKDAEEVFQSGIEQLDFADGAAAATVINQWVAEQTAGMIKDVVDPASLDADTGLVLVNAIYFQGLWENRFVKELTRNRTFHVNNRTEIKVPMMTQIDYFRYKYTPKLNAKILQMDYEGDQASLVIVLPDEVEGLGDVMQQLAAGHHLMDEIAGLKRTKIMIPKFKIETNIDLMHLLPKMGIKSIFDKETSGIRMLKSDKRLYVSQAVQRAVIEVDEKGTEAAACTSFGCQVRRSSAILPKTQSFIADRPFLFLLTARQIPLFLGVYQGSEFAV